jgi:hypothetical protein
MCWMGANHACDKYPFHSLCRLPVIIFIDEPVNLRQLNWLNMLCNNDDNKRFGLESLNASLQSKAC